MAEPKQAEKLPEKYPPVFDDDSDEKEGEEAVKKVVEKAVGEKDVDDEDDEESEGEMEVEDLTELRVKSAKEKRTLRVSGINLKSTSSFTIDTQSNKMDRLSSPRIGIPTCPIKPLWAFQMAKWTVIEMLSSR